MKTPTIRAALYARCSTDKQRVESLDDQYHVCEQVAKREDFVVVDRFGDREISGGTADRPGYQSMLDAPLTVQIKLAMAEHARREASYRTRRGLDGLARAQKPTGGRAYGFIAAKDGTTGRIEIHAEHAAIVLRIFEMYANAGAVRRVAVDARCNLFTIAPLRVFSTIRAVPGGPRGSARAPHSMCSRCDVEPCRSSPGFGKS